MTTKEITLHEYVKAEHERLDAFSDMWRRGMKCNGNNYPARMAPGEWDEQLVLFHYLIK